MGLLGDLTKDILKKAEWRYGSTNSLAMGKALLGEGTFATFLYRCMQWSRRWRLVPLEMIFNKINSICCHCVIGRGAEFGPGFVLLHSNGVVINGAVCGGSNIILEHQVTIGSEKNKSPRLGNDIYIGAGAKILGAVTIGDGARIGANAVVVLDVPAYATAVGVPARIVRVREPGAAES